MLPVECIARCVENIKEADIIWHNEKWFCEDGIELPESHKTNLDCLNIPLLEVRDKSFSPLELLRDRSDFWFVCDGMISFSLLKNLRFYPYIKHEDTLFGVLLFAAARSIRIDPFCGYLYRIRSGSICNHDKKYNRSNFSLFIGEITRAFTHSAEIHEYYRAYSHMHIAVSIIKSALENDDKNMRAQMLVYARSFANLAFGNAVFSQDPLNLKANLKHLEQYMKLAGVKLRSSVKLKYHYPHLYKINKKIEAFYKKLLQKIFPKKKK